MIRRALRYIVRGVPVVKTYAKVNYLTPSNVLKDKHIVVTGGGKGLGYSMAKRFVKEGATVLITGRHEDVLLASSKEIGCKYLVQDITCVKEMNAFWDKADELLNGVNCLVNNAGISLHEEGFLDVTEEQFDMQFNINLKGAFFLTQSFIKRKLEEKERSTTKILFISSETSMTVDERPYGLTKAALNSLIQGLACRFVKEGFRINAIAPGITASNMTGYDPEGDLYLSLNPTNRVFLPDEVAEIATFVLGDQSNILNGQIIYTNEGRTINTRW